MINFMYQKFQKPNLCFSSNDKIPFYDANILKISFFYSDNGVDEAYKTSEQKHLEESISFQITT
ncbi:hypothetical protein CWI37_0015p0040 [Hamiltosporidium tvaerminnensis]|uniref:Uncharacterized protein n=1 Tax=Hamiltosporidium tvaerminnensis TaxID=1176355 RepID=A0A4Q9LCC5_9MICR|nr:hypothetical protein CWI37_0015p0040 [Hamiltosporidium tvaerminnensis]